MVAVGCQSFPSSALASSKQRAILSPLHLLLASMFAQGRWQLSKYSGGTLIRRHRQKAKLSEKLL
jgi:hypothetical protein